MKELIMFSVLAFSSLSFASNEHGALLKNNLINHDLNEYGCYEIVATTVSFVNYNIVNSASVTNYNIFNTEQEVIDYIEQRKLDFPDSMVNGNGHKTFYTYKMTRIINCV